jgi:hypothetical protein
MTDNSTEAERPACPLNSAHGPHGSCQGTGDLRVADRITLTTHTLGLEPYVLIRAVPDGDDLRLKVEHNDDGAALAALYLLNLPAADNPLTAAIKAVVEANPDFPEAPDVLRIFAEFCDIPMPEFD